jgi:hypothetical protein
MKTVIAILTLTVLTLSCNDNGKTGRTENTQITEQDSLTLTLPQKTRPTIDLIHETENLKLYGDTTIDKDKISYASIKFEPYISFDDFKVTKVDNKKYAELDLKSNEMASSYRTRLREGYKADTANFAGHYTFVYFGCGSPCQGSLVIDRKTGKVYDSPSASLGYDFRADSRMLIVNPPDTSGFYDDCFYCKPTIYIFDEQTKKFNERQRR